MTTDTIFTLTCRKCNVAYPLPPTRCAACGPTFPVWEGRPSEDTRWVACSKCHRCLQRQESAKLPETQDCPDCGTPDQGWRDAQGNWWDPAHQLTSQLPETWISGQFDGNYDGALLAGHADGLSLRSYTFAVREAVLSGVHSLAAPPLPIDSSNLAPLRLPIVRNVHIVYYGSDMQPRSLLADLHDFRLHAWGNASTEQVANGRPSLAGRFWGTAYARLSMPTEQSVATTTSPLVSHLAPDDSAIASIESSAPINPADAEIITAAGSNIDRDPDSDVHASDIAHADPNHSPQQGNTTTIDTHDTASPDTPGHSDRQTPEATLHHQVVTPPANPSVNPGHQYASASDAGPANALPPPTSMPTEAAGAGTKSDNALSTAAPAPREKEPRHDASSQTIPLIDAEPQIMPRPTTSPTEATEAGGESADRVSPSPREPHEASKQRGTHSQATARPHESEQTLISRYVSLRQRLWGKQPFLRPRWPLFLGIAGLILGLLCGWPVMLIGLGALLLHRATHLALFKHRRWPSPRWRRWVHPLPLLVLALLAFFAIIEHSNSPQCLQPSWFWVSVLGLLLLLSALTRVRLVSVVIALLWLAALLTAFRDQGTTCGQTLSQSVRTSVQTTGAQIERQAKELVTYDQDAEIVSTSTTKSQGEQRVSLTQALEDPSKYFSCVHASSNASVRPIEIYLGESALFGFNSDRLNSEAEANLSKLGTLIAHNPDASIVLTGHTDKLGVPLLNIKLSEQRAKRVAEWLVTHDVLPADRIDVRGAGDRDPVVDDPALYRMNRRVEMHIDCPEAPLTPAPASAQPPSSTKAATSL